MAQDKETILLLDGNSLLHRAWHALPPLTTKDGRVVHAAYGFAMALEKMLQQFKPTYMAVAWDLPGKTFRHEVYEAYKGTREEKAQELYDQIPLIQDILDAFGIPSLSAEGFEADDVIGTLSKKAEKKQIKTLIVTGDLDALQLVDAETDVIFFQKGISETKTYDVEAILERYGLTPEELVDYKALRGDPSDNIPGVPGIGEKTAIILVQNFGSVPGILKALKADEIEEKFAKKIRGNERALKDSRYLVEIVKNVPVKFRFDDARIKNPNREKLLHLYRDLEFRTLLRKHAGTVEAPPLEIPSRISKKKKDVQIVRELSDLVDQLSVLKPDHLAVLATEQAQDLFGASMAAIAVSDGVFCVVVQNPTDKHLEKIAEYIHAAKDIVTHDLKGLMGLTGWEMNQDVMDLKIGSYLLHPGSRTHDILSIAQNHVDEKLPEIPEQFGTEKEYEALGTITAALPKLAKVVLEALKEHEMLKVFHEIEMPLVPILFHMEKEGIQLDVKSLGAFQKTLKKRIDELTLSITKEAGVEFNINSPSQLAGILFETLKLPIKGIKKTKSGYSTAAPELEKLEGSHPIISQISEYRELTKLQSTYVEVLPKLIGRDGRIHTSFNQTVAATGRLSSSNPNLQNIPIKTELGNKIREAFVAGRGKKLIAADYSQIELRLVSVIAKDAPFIQAFQEGADVHTRTAAEVWEIAEADVTSQQRRAAKAINFGIIYGMGPRSLAKSTGMTFAEAQDFIARYFQIHQAVRNYLDETKINAHQNEFVETMFGRKRFLPEINSGVPMVVAAAERMAINMPVQGTAADLMKMAMIALDGWLKQSQWPARVLLQVHDELVVECTNEAVDAVANGMKEMMEGVASFDVPLVVDVEIGSNWGEMSIKTFDKPSGK